MEDGYTCQVTFGIEGKAIINRLAKFNSKDDACVLPVKCDTLRQNATECDKVRRNATLTLC